MFSIKPEYQEKIKTWYKKKNKVFIISGFAGCGKTTLARQIPELLKIKSFAFLAPTGKASLLLGKGKTIHSYLYDVYKDEHNDLQFRRKDRSEFSEQLLLVDEISMVNEELFNDLVSLNIPIIGLGDSNQLPPVTGENNILDNPDIFLTEVFRNDSGILELATDIRLNKKLKRTYTDVQFTTKLLLDDLKMKDFIDMNTAVICKFNKTRQKINGFVRQYYLKYKNILEIGDKLIVIRNNKATGLMNGSVITVESIASINTDKMIAQILVKDQLGTKHDLFVDLLEITNRSDEDKKRILSKTEKQELHYIDYAYAITCHKAQGSEYDNVYIVNEGKSFDNHDKWFYTAVTRAKKKVKVYRNI